MLGKLIPRNWLLRIVLLGNFLATLLLFLVYLSPFVSPQTSYWLALFALGYPLLLITHILLIIWWLYWRSRAVYFSLIPVAMGITPFFNFLGVSGNASPAKGASLLMTYNTHYLNSLGYNTEAATKNQNQMLNYIAQQKPDIFCAQEFSGRTGDLTNAARAWVSTKMGLTYQHFGGGSSLAIYSRYPIVATGAVLFESSHNAAIYADIQMPKKIIRVYNMHLQSIKLGADSDEVLNKYNLTHLNNKETKEKYKRISSKLHRAFVMRADQAEKLAAHIRQSPHPVVLAGDMNDVPQSYAYRQVSAGLRDSFWERGWGLGTTYAGNLPFLRIDYVFASPSLPIYTHTVPH